MILLDKQFTNHQQFDSLRSEASSISRQSFFFSFFLLGSKPLFISKWSIHFEESVFSFFNMKKEEKKKKSMAVFVSKSK